MSIRAIIKPISICIPFCLAGAWHSVAWAAAQGPAPAASGGAADGTSLDVGTLKEIVVTAQKRRESLINVPVAVSVVSQTALKNNAASNLSNIAELVPQVMIGSVSTGTGAVLSIRGISSSPLDAGIDQSVSVVVDGVQLSRGRITTQSMYDLSNVQVLKGPQALFFGKNSPAGVIDIVANQPTSTLTGYVDAGYEFVAAERYLQGAISGPVTNTLKVRFAFRADQMNGWIRNTATPEADPFIPGVTLPGAWTNFSPRDRNYSGRFIADWTPTDSFSAKASLELGTDRANSGETDIVPYCVNGVTVPTDVGVPDPQGNCRLNMTEAISALPRQVAINYPFGNGGVPYETSTDWLASLKLNEELRDVTLTSSTGYYTQRVADSGNYDVDSFANVYDAEFERYGLLEQELRATSHLSGPLNYTVGAYFDHSTRYHFNAPYLFDTGINPATGNYTNNEQAAWNGGNTASAFAQGRWKIIPSLELAGGARWTYQKQHDTIGNLAVNPYGILRDPTTGLVNLMPAGVFLTPHLVDHNVSPEVTLTWHPVRGQTLYAAYKTGYKSGGFSNTATLYDFYTPAAITFSHELSKGGEIGYKGVVLHNTLRYSLTGYLYNYYGLQVTAFDASTISYTIRNAANSRTEGIEGSIEWSPFLGLDFHGSFGYNHAYYENFPGAQCYPGQTQPQGCLNGQQNLIGQPLVDAPKLAYNIGSTYRVRLPYDLVADLGLSGAYSGGYEIGADGNPELWQHAYWLLDSSIRLSSVADTWSVSLIGRNLTNSFYAISGNERTLGGPNQLAGYFNRPREVIVEVGYHF